MDDSAGCRLTSVDDDSPAAKAGLKVGDIVLKVDGREVKVYASFLRWIDEAQPGETLNLEIKRGDQLLTLERQSSRRRQGGAHEAPLGPGLAALAAPRSPSQLAGAACRRAG